MQKKDKYCLDCFLGSGDLDTILLYSKNKIEKRAVIEHKGRYIFGMITAGNNVYNLNIIKKNNTKESILPYSGFVIFNTDTDELMIRNMISGSRGDTLIFYKIDQYDIRAIKGKYIGFEALNLTINSSFEQLKPLLKNFSPNR